MINRSRSLEIILYGNYLEFLNFALLFRSLYYPRIPVIQVTMAFNSHLIKIAAILILLANFDQSQARTGRAGSDDLY